MTSPSARRAGAGAEAAAPAAGLRFLTSATHFVTTGSPRRRQREVARVQLQRARAVAQVQVVQHAEVQHRGGVVRVDRQRVVVGVARLRELAALAIREAQLVPGDGQAGRERGGLLELARRPRAGGPPGAPAGRGWRAGRRGRDRTASARGSRVRRRRRGRRASAPARRRRRAAWPARSGRWTRARGAATALARGGGARGAGGAGGRRGRARGRRRRPGAPRRRMPTEPQPASSAAGSASAPASASGEAFSGSHRRSPRCVRSCCSAPAAASSARRSSSSPTRRRCRRWCGAR